jgi:hypothetical protein
MLEIIILIGVCNYIILMHTETSDGVKAYVMIMATLLLLWLFTTKDMIEGIGSTVQNESYEAIQNLASMYNSGTLSVTNLQVTNNATIGGNATITGGLTSQSAQIGNWNIRDIRMGVSGAADISNAPDWMRINAYNTNNYHANGIAANNFAENGVNLANKYIGTGNTVRLANGYGNLTTCGQTSCNGILAMSGGTNNADAQSSLWKISTPQLPNTLNIA